MSIRLITFGLIALFCWSQPGQAKSNFHKSFRSPVQSLRLAAKHLNRNVELFEISASMNPSAPNFDLFVETALFSLPGDNLFFVKASLFLTVKGEAIQVGKKAYVVGACGGIPLPQCDQPTGEEEPAEYHAAISNWKIDLPELKLAVAKVTFGKQGYFATINTMARLRAKGVHDMVSEQHRTLMYQLRHLDGDTPVLSLIDKVSSGDPKFTSHFVIVNLITGKVEADGQCNKELPKPGAVSSGG